MDNTDVKTRLAAAKIELEKIKKDVDETFAGVRNSVSLLNDAIDGRGDALSALAEQGHYEHELKVAIRGWMEHGYHADRAAFITSVYEEAVKAWDKSHIEQSNELELLLEDLEKQDIQ